METNNNQQRNENSETPSNRSQLIEKFDELVILIERGNWLALAALLEKEEYRKVINFKDPHDNGFGLIHYSAKRNDPECIRVVVENQWCDRNLKDNFGRSGLHILISGKCRCHVCTEKAKTCIQLVINNGGDANIEDHNRKTPLCYAVEKFLSQYAILLLNMGASLHVE